MLWLTLIAIYLASVAVNFVIGLLHSFLCLWLIENSDYKFVKVTQRRVTLNALYVNRAEQRRRDDKPRAAFQWIDTTKLVSRNARNIGHVANFLIFLLKTLNWVFWLSIPVFLVWYWTLRDQSGA